MSLIISKANHKSIAEFDGSAKPNGFWNGKNIIVYMGWGKSHKGKVRDYTNGVFKFEDGFIAREEEISEIVNAANSSAMDSAAQDGIDKHYREYSDGADRETKAAIENIGKAINDAMKIAEKWVKKNRVGSSSVLSQIRYGVKERYDNQKSELIRLASLMNAEELDD